MFYSVREKLCNFKAIIMFLSEHYNFYKLFVDYFVKSCLKDFKLHEYLQFVKMITRFCY